MRTLVFAFLLALGCQKKLAEPPRFLLFSKTAGFRHESIAAGRACFEKIAAANGWGLDATESSDFFNEKNLAKYRAVVFLNTTGDVLNDTQQLDFQRFIKKGGGFVGVHSATDTEYDWPFYTELVGAQFEGHPEIQPARLEVKNRSHESCRHLADEWRRTDEWYNLQKVSPRVNVLLRLDETTYSGGNMGENHPAAWFHEFGGGRAFYTAGGHTVESYGEPDFRKHLEGALGWAMKAKS